MLLLHGRFPGRAQLTLDECRRLAREHYPEIRQYDLIRQTAEYTLSNARRAYLPPVRIVGARPRGRRPSPISPMR